MKIRNGFVSNSSSSSFIVFGVAYDYSDIPEETYNKIVEYVKGKNNLSEDDLDYWDFEAAEDVINFAEEYGEPIGWLDDDNFYIGEFHYLDEGWSYIDESIFENIPDKKKVAKDFIEKVGLPEKESKIIAGITEC